MAVFIRKPREVAAIKLCCDGTLTDMTTEPPTPIPFALGSWLVRQPNGRQEIVSDTDFREMYAPKPDDQAAEAMYNDFVEAQEQVS